MDIVGMLAHVSKLGDVIDRHAPDIIKALNEHTAAMKDHTNALKKAAGTNES